MSDFGQEYKIKIRKERPCIWCGQIMPKGSAAYNYRGMWQGDWQNWTMHPECYEYHREDYDNDDGFSPYDNPRPCGKKIKVRE